MLSYTSNFNGLVGSLSRLNNNSNSANSALLPMQNQSDASEFTDSVNSTASGFRLPFEGFEQQLGQRYSMPQNQTMQLLQMFIMVLEELIGNVVTNSSGGNNKPDASSSSQNGLQQLSQAEQKNTANRTEIIANEQADKAPNAGGVWGSTNNSPTSSAPDAVEKKADAPVAKAPNSGGVWGSTNNSPTSSAPDAVEKKADAPVAKAPNSGGVWGSTNNSPTSSAPDAVEKKADTPVEKAPNSGSVWGSTNSSPTPSTPDAAEKIADTPVVKAPGAGGVWGSTNNSSANSGINSVASTHATEATEAPSASGGEATQAHKSGGCPFMAMQSEQNSNSSNVQSTNNPVMPSAGLAGSEGSQGMPSVGVAGSKGSQGSLFMGKSSNATKPVENGNNTTSLDEADNRDIDFSTLSKAERSSMGLSDRERAVVHLWGRQMMSAGEQDGGIYTNVLGADGSGADWGNKDEVALIQELRAQEQERFGADTGWLLDEAYFDIMKDKTGVDMSERYADRPVRNSKGPVNITNDIKTLEERTGISGFEQGVIRLMGHDALMDGEFDGSVLEFTVGNANSLDSSKHSGGITNTIDGTAEALLAEDKSDDGQVNGSSILNQTINTLDRLYA